MNTKITRPDFLARVSWRALIYGSAVYGIASATVAPAWAQQAPEVLPQINVTDSADSRLGGGITGASTTIITKEDIERAPQATLVEILSREAGVQSSNLFSGAGGASGSVDMRGFGVTGPSNTLVLVNGRRQNDSDLPGFDFSTVAKNSIERIEITRGNSGAVLYGDGAVGGVINIVTKNGVNAPPSLRVDGTFGLLGYREGSFNGNVSNGPWSAAAFANAVSSTGYRTNNSLNQRVGGADIRYTVDQGSAYLNVSGDTQNIGLPGSRDILTPGDSFTAPFNQVATDPQGTSTPFNSASKDVVKVSGGASRIFMPGVEGVFDAGYRVKKQGSSFFNFFSVPQYQPLSYFGANLETGSITPRLNINRSFMGIPVRATGGVDYYQTNYDSDRRQSQFSAPIHHYMLGQRTLAGYWQQTMTFFSSTDISAGGRIQRNNLDANDRYDATAPVTPGFGGSVGSLLNKSETQNAYHLGIEHRFNDTFAMFGRAAQSFRVPNVDERVGAGGLNVPTNFNLKPQQSHDIEGGVRVKYGRFSLQSSVYDMMVTNELHLDPVSFANTNLDPTRRTGVENIATWRLTDTVALKGTATYTHATFRSGPFSGKVVPLVAPWTGNVGVSWNILDKRLVFDGVVRHVGPRFLDQDEANVLGMHLAPQTLVDVRLGGEVENFFWSLSVQNLFDNHTIDYGLGFTYNDFITNALVSSYSFYPLAGRTYMVKAGMKFGPQ